MYSPFRIIVLFSFIAYFTCVKAHEEDRVSNVIEEELFMHLGVHSATYIVSATGLALSIFAGKIVADILSEKGAPALAYYSSHILFAIAGGYIFYKTPQWTDTYLLDIKDTRSTKINIVVSLSRIIFFPAGELIGEYFAKKIKRSEWVKKTVQK